MLCGKIFIFGEGQYLRGLRYTGGPAAPIVIIRHHSKEVELGSSDLFCSWQ